MLADWIQSVAASLVQDGSGLRTWGTFYAEARKALEFANGLRQLGGKTVLKTRDGSLLAAAVGGAPVFVREAGLRDRDRAPLPPSAVASKFAILDDKIPMAPEVVTDFIKAGLLRRYDALQVLQSVHSLFGEKPAPKRREATLKWALEVWRAEGSRAEKILREVDLHVETRSGWRPASTARFSEGWTADGRRLATYLAEFGPYSPDCAQAAELLLAVRSLTGCPRWTAAAVVSGRTSCVRPRSDGLPLLDDENVPKEGTPHQTWDTFRSTAAPRKGRSRAWVKANSAIRLPNPQTRYSRKGALWRIPGQVSNTRRCRPRRASALPNSSSSSSRTTTING